MEDLPTYLSPESESPDCSGYHDAWRLSPFCPAEDQSAFLCRIRAGSSSLSCADANLRIRRQAVVTLS